MKLEYQDRIDAYVLERMTAAERAQLEQDVAQDAEMREQLEFTQEVKDAITSYQDKLAAVRQMHQDYELLNGPMFAAAAASAGYEDEDPDRHGHSIEHVEMAEESYCNMVDDGILYSIDPETETGCDSADMSYDSVDSCDECLWESAPRHRSSATVSHRAAFSYNAAPVASVEKLSAPSAAPINVKNSSHPIKKIWLWAVGIAAVLVAGFFVLPPVSRHMPDAPCMMAPDEVPRGDGFVIDEEYDCAPALEALPDSLEENFDEE